MNTNKVILVGRLTSDPEFKVVNQTNIASFTIAVNGMKENDTSFINCNSFGKTAEVISKYADKGKLVCITGYLKQERWEKDGKKNSMLKVNVETIELLSSGKKEEKKETSQETYDQPIPNTTVEDYDVF